MKAIAFPAILLVTALPIGARAECWDLQEFLHRAKAAVQSLVGPTMTDHDVITPPEIDRRMALAPSGDGAMTIIEPPARLKQR